MKILSAFLVAGTLLGAPTLGAVEASALPLAAPSTAITPDIAVKPEKVWCRWRYGRCYRYGYYAPRVYVRPAVRVRLPFVRLRVF